MRIGVKVGSSLLVREESGSFIFRYDFAQSLMIQLSELINQGHEVFLVSSGAVASDGDTTHSKALRAAIGQHKLMAVYQDCLTRNCHPPRYAAQLLLVADELRDNREHICGLIEEAFKNNVLAVINANDAVNGDELDRLEEFEDNDQLFQDVCLMLEPDAAIIATDVDGVLDEHSRVMQCFTENDADSWYIMTRQNFPNIRIGTGGMASKVEVGLFLISRGIGAIIVNGNADNFVERAINQLACGQSLGYKFGTSFTL